MEAILKTILPLLLAAAIPPTLHAQITAHGRLSGTQLVERWTSPDANSRDRSPAAILAREYVDGYLAGVADASEGVAWCNTHLIKTHEVDAEVVGVLKSLPASQASRTSAAQLVVKALALRFPCRGGAK